MSAKDINLVKYDLPEPIFTKFLPLRQFF